MVPLEDSAEGTLVFDAGDALLPMGKYVEQPIRMEIREGSIVSIERGADSRLLKDFFCSRTSSSFPRTSGPTVSLTSVVGTSTGPIGTPGPSLLGRRGCDGHRELLYGNMLNDFCANFFRKLGGENRANLYFDIPTRNHSIWIGDTQIIDRGSLVAPGFQLE